jgi:hypothetical protein
MKGVLTRLRWLAVLPLLLPFSLAHADANLPTVLIVEVQTTGPDAASSQEFIELFNASEDVIDISDWRVEYFSASAPALTTPSRSIPLHGRLAPGDTHLLASTDYLTDIADETFSPTLAKTGGHVRLVSGQDDQLVVHDLLGWGSAAHPEGTAAPAPGDGFSLQRRLDTEGRYIDTDNNAADFAVNGVPTPESHHTEATTTEPPVEEGENQTPPEQTPQEPPQSDVQAQEPLPTETVETPSPTLLPLRLSELLPNPAPPASDNSDEFVELYNPNDEAVDLEGYKLQTGNSFSYSYTLTDDTIGPRSYLALPVTRTGLLLANSGGKARLLDPGGAVISETSPYAEAPDGQAWAFITGTWQWTLLPTPDQPNELLLPAPKPVKAASVKKAATKTAAKKTTAKVKAASTTTKKKTALPVERDVYEDPAQITVAPVHPLIIAGVSAAALLYAGYEYRFDAANRLYQFRRYRADRRAARRTA